MDNMENNKVFKINELVTIDNNLDLLDNVDRCYIDTKNVLGFDVYVAGGDDYGNGLEKYSKPHFHVILRKDNDVFKYRFEIPSNDEFILKVIDSGLNGFKYIKDVENKLNKWLVLPSDYTPYNTNLKEIKIFWNHLNKYNKNLIIST